jgi:hypothetical protein
VVSAGAVEDVLSVFHRAGFDQAAVFGTLKNNDSRVPVN